MIIRALSNLLEGYSQPIKYPFSDFYRCLWIHEAQLTLIRIVIGLVVRLDSNSHRLGGFQTHICTVFYLKFLLEELVDLLELQIL